MKCTIAALATSLALLSLPAVVSAQAVGGQTPTFATMDRLDGESKLGTQLAWTFFDESLIGGDISTLRIDLYGHYVTPGGLGGYGQLPVTMLFSDGDDENAIGNLEAGAMYVLPSNNGMFVFHGGITLPTADDDVGGAITNFYGAFARITDFALAYPETFWLRLGGSAIIHSGQLVLRVDGGLDVAMSSEGEEPDPLLRLNVGGGLDTGTFAILGELATLGNIDNGVGGDEDYIHTAAVTGRFNAGTVQPVVSLGFPLDEAIRDAVEFFVIAGIQGSI